MVLDLRLVEKITECRNIANLLSFFPRRRLCTCSSRDGTRRGWQCHSLCTCSAPAGARICLCRRSLHIGSSPADVRRCLCRRSLYTCSSPAGACRCRYRRSLPCSSAALVLAEDRGLAGLLGCRRMWRRSCGCSRARCVGWVRITLVVLAALALWPSGCVPLLQHSLLALRGSLRAIRVIRHPALRLILHVKASCAVGAALPLFRGVQVSSSVWKETISPSTERCGEAGRPTRLPDKERTSTRNASLAPLLSLRHCPGAPEELPKVFANLAGRSREFVKSRFQTNSMGLLTLISFLHLTLYLSVSRSLSRSLALSPCLALALSLFVSSQPRRRR